MPGSFTTIQQAIDSPLVSVGPRREEPRGPRERRAERGVALTPETLDDVNPISRNLGDNRGHGLAPSVFLAD